MLTHEVLVPLCPCAKHGCLCTADLQVRGARYCLACPDDPRRHVRPALTATAVQPPPASPGGIIQQAGRFAAAMARWALAGRPVTSSAGQARRRALCMACPDRAPDDSCRRCGCSLGGTAILPAKIEMATEECPAGKWAREA